MTENDLWQVHTGNSLYEPAPISRRTYRVRWLGWGLAFVVACVAAMALAGHVHEWLK